MEHEKETKLIRKIRQKQKRKNIYIKFITKKKKQYYKIAN